MRRLNLVWAPQALPNLHLCNPMLWVWAQRLKNDTKNRKKNFRIEPDTTDVHDVQMSCILVQKCRFFLFLFIARGTVP